MRADRLVAILMLLQKNGLTTAESLAKELEVSERTIYRDVDALCIAGVPLTTQSGPGGGISLLESYRTDLTGLTSAESEALLALSVPAPLFDVGLGADLRSALRKLAAAAPGPRGRPESKIQEKLYIDSSEWSETTVSGGVFEAIRRALWADMELVVSYDSELGNHAGAITAVVRPLGLVAAAGAWYLVAGHEEHTVVIPVVRLRKAQSGNRYFQRPSDFQLQDYWLSRAALVQRQRPELNVVASVSPSAIPYLGDRLVARPQRIASDERCRVTLRFESFEGARTWILGMGSSVEVVTPLSLRLSVIDFARQVVSLYEN